MAGIEHQLVHEDNARKGPKGKSPWIEDGSVRIGDTALIVEYLRKKYGVDPDAGATPGEAARNLALQRMLEEHTHQVVEYELIVDDRGWPVLRAFFASALPPVARTIVPHFVRSVTRRQLHARGLARHSRDEIARMGIADAEAVECLLEDAPFLGGARPRSVDASAFGMLGMLAFSPLTTPVASRIRDLPHLMSYLEGLRGRWFAGHTGAAEEKA
jgi:glutathione S-transferase